MSWYFINFSYAVFKVHARCDGCGHIKNGMRWKLASISFFVFWCIGMYAAIEENEVLEIGTQPSITFSDWCFISHHIHKTSFAHLITGKTSYPNSTALLTGLAAISCCSSVPVSMLYGGSGSAFFFFLMLAATCSPTPSPVQYHRPLRS